MNKETIIITMRCPRRSYIKWWQEIELLVNKRYDVVESSIVDQTIPMDEMNRTVFSFEVHWHFARDFIDVLCLANPYLNDQISTGFKWALLTQMR